MREQLLWQFAEFIFWAGELTLLYLIYENTRERKK